MIDNIMYCHITLSNPINQEKQIVLDFELFPTNISMRWKEQVLLAQHLKYSIDDPLRFYGLNDKDIDIAIALNKINDNIKTINSYQLIIDKELNSIEDQDTLNYLHHIFEVYHGLLDKQNTDFWKNAPCNVQKALANLNVDVHRIESLQRTNSSRFVVTYFQLPKTQKLEEEDYNYLTDYYSFGGLYLNYVEIGKTLEDLMKDNDQYIHPDAFKPWKHFSADMAITLHDSNIIDSRINKQNCLRYFRENREFFESHGYKEYDPRLRPGRIQIGQMKYVDKHKTLELIKQHQYVVSVNFS
jgi:hypothetical protein